MRMVTLNVDTNNNLIDFDLALSVAKLYEMPQKQALEDLNEIRNTVEASWRKLAQNYGINRSEIESMSPAFDMAFK